MFIVLLSGFLKARLKIGVGEISVANISIRGLIIGASSWK